MADRLPQITLEDLTEYVGYHLEEIDWWLPEEKFPEYYDTLHDYWHWLAYGDIRI